MTILLRICMYAAAAVFCASITVNIVSHLGIRIPGGDAVMMLHVAAMAVFAPAVLVSNGKARKGQRPGWDELLRGCPPRMKAGVVWLGIYAFGNFLYFMTTKAAHTKPQAHPVAPEIVTGFSGHWMIFSALAFAMLYSALHDRPSAARA